MFAPNLEKVNTWSGKICTDSDEVAGTEDPMVRKLEELLEDIG